MKFSKDTKYKFRQVKEPYKIEFIRKMMVDGKPATTFLVTPLQTPDYQFIAVRNLEGRATWDSNITRWDIVEDKLEILPGKHYKTRNGMLARVYAVDAGAGGPIHGAVRASENGAWMMKTWNKNGFYALDSYDLVEMVEDEA